MMFHVEHVLQRFFPNKDVNKIKDQLVILKERYFKWNQTYNISSIRDEDGFWIKHVMDSLCLAKYLIKDEDVKTIVDVGSGGGFPAIILSLILEADVIALEPIKKKTDFIDHCRLKLDLENLKTLNLRFEEFDLAQGVVVSRALGLYNELSEHFFSQSKNLRIVLMTTKKNIGFLDFKYVISDEPYKMISELSKGLLSEHVLCEIFPEKSN